MLSCRALCSCARLYILKDSTQTVATIRMMIQTVRRVLFDSADGGIHQPEQSCTSMPANVWICCTFAVDWNSTAETTKMIQKIKLHAVWFRWKRKSSSNTTPYINVRAQIFWRNQQVLPEICMIDAHDTEIACAQSPRSHGLTACLDLPKGVWQLRSWMHTCKLLVPKVNDLMGIVQFLIENVDSFVQFKLSDNLAVDLLQVRTIPADESTT